MTLTSESTYEDAVAAYKTNSAYEITGSVSMAKQFVQAIRVLLLEASASSSRSHSVQYDRQTLAAQLRDAQSFIAANDSTGAVRFVGFRGRRP